MSAVIQWRHVLSAVSYGPEVEALARRDGVVGAVTGRGIYLHGDGGAIVGMVDASAADGPLTLRVHGLAAALPDFGVDASSPFAGDGETVNIAGKVEIKLHGARPWQPPAVKLTADSRQLEEATGALHSAISGQRARGGLGRILDFGRPEGTRTLDSKSDSEDPKSKTQNPKSDIPLLRRAGRALGALTIAWDDGDGEGVTRAALELLGLGPGLTPSGDDLLMGLLAVCKWTEEESPTCAQLGGALAHAVALEAPARTTRLSARLLDHAASGLLYEPAMRLGGLLLSGQVDRIKPAAQRLFEIGHSSGVDMAVGILIGAALGPKSKVQSPTP
jgi:hypothetical protein